MKQRFGTLDAMRGFAALTVLLYHVDQGFFETSCAVADNCEMRFGYLAVDMFFALSGFVLGYRYDQAFVGGLSWTHFMRLRVIRLAPIYWIGAVLGAVPLLTSFAHGAARASIFKVLLFNAVLLPSPTFHTHVDPFPLVSPAWSLFYELWVANLLFALIGSKLRGAVLYGLIAAGAIGLLASTSWYGTLDNGALWTNFAGGFPRVIYSFFAGVAVQRLHAARPASSMPAGLILILLLASFVVHVPPPLHAAYELACVLLLYPALIYLGASAVERHPLLGKMLGDASFALYVIHIPIMLLLLQYMTTHGVAISYGMGVVFVVVALGAAVLIDAVYDAKAKRVLGRVLRIR